MKTLFALLISTGLGSITNNRCEARQFPSTPVRDAKDNAQLDAEIVDALNTRCGVHAGFRSNHAKGVVFEGSFVATPEAASLTTSPIYSAEQAQIGDRADHRQP